MANSLPALRRSGSVCPLSAQVTRRQGTSDLFLRYTDRSERARQARRAAWTASQESAGSWLLTGDRSRRCATQSFVMGDRSSTIADGGKGDLLCTGPRRKQRGDRHPRLQDRPRAGNEDRRNLLARG